MARKRTVYGITVKMKVMPIDNKLVMLLEWLRYAGVIGKVDTAPADRSANSTLTFNIYCPGYVANKSDWAEQNAERINSFGENVKAMVVKRIV